MIMLIMQTVSNSILNSIREIVLKTIILSLRSYVYYTEAFYSLLVLENIKILASVYRYKLACRVFSEGQQSVLTHSEGHHCAFCKLILFTYNMHALSKPQYYLHS